MPDNGHIALDLRAAREADASALTMLRAAFWSDQIAKGSRDNPDIEPAKLLADTTNLVKRARTMIFVAADREKLVGYLLSQTKIVPGAAGSAVSSIEEIFVLPEYRRTTVARKLVECALDGFRATGSQRFQLRVLEYNDAGKAFWTRLGFSPAVTIYEYTGLKD
jgi:ribosomal protein S18 acetylase RimI-like enzyme